MPALVKAQNQKPAALVPAPRPLPKPKLRDQLFAKLDALPAAMAKDVREVVGRAEAEIAKQAVAGGEQGKVLSAALEKMSATLQAKLGESMSDLVSAVLELRAELKERPQAEAKPKSWRAEVKRVDGKIDSMRFIPE